MKKEKLIALVIGLLLLLFLIFIISRPEASFNKIILDKENVVVNNLHDKYLDTVVKVGLQELNIKGVYVMIRASEKDAKISGREDLELKAYIIGRGSGYIVYVNNLNGRREAIRVISHELIHLKQYKNSNIEIDGTKVFWNKKEINISEIPYESLPWEVEAFNEEGALEKKINTILYR